MSERTACRLPHRAWPLVLIAVGLCAWSSSGTRALGAEPADVAPAAGGFHTILERHQRETVRAVAQYVAQNPEAADAQQARLWVFEAATTYGYEADVLPLAEAFLERTDLEPAQEQLARQVAALGLAKKGDLTGAVAMFERHLRGVRFQAAQRTLDFAHALATQARLANDFAAAREIYEQVAAAFPLSPQVTEVAENRLAKLELVGEPAPRIAAEDLKGTRIDLGDYTGKVVLVDFWATNCPPCLDEFPGMKQLYEQYHDSGFEIVGISLDESPELVETFVARTKLPWRMGMNAAAEGPVSRRYAVLTIPSLYLIDRQGKIAQVDVRGRDLRTCVEKLLKEKSAN